MRTLPKWSDNSFSTTTPRPCQGEPSRRMGHLLGCCALRLEVARIDGLEARPVERELMQMTAGGDNDRGSFAAHVALAHHAPAPRRRLRYAAHARKPGEPVGNMRAARGLDLDDIATTKHHTTKHNNRAHERDLPAIEERDAVAHALHAVEQMRRQDDGHALRLERADEVEQVDARLRVEAVGRLIEDGDARVFLFVFGVVVVLLL